MAHQSPRHFPDQHFVFHNKNQQPENHRRLQLRLVFKRKHIDNGLCFGYITSHESIAQVHDACPIGSRRLVRNAKYSFPISR
jgi:hypothetical protein